MNRKYIWLIWILLTLLATAYLTKILLVDEDKSQFLIGEATHGHFQIELACESCHKEPFGGKDALQEACNDCHAQDLEMAHDSHPRKKFTDPREAYRIEILDARYCTSCHTEHQKEQTNAMGLTIPEDYCFHCHQEVLEERESHKNLDFKSCASAGCHNFHDNRALYESFLVNNHGQLWVKEMAKIAKTTATQALVKASINVSGSQYLDKINAHPEIAKHWQASSHAKGGVDCGGCHKPDNSSHWIDKPNLDQCESCHKKEVQGFTQGKHGMRLAKGLSKELSPMKSSESKMRFTKISANVEHGCNACHSAHTFDTKSAAADSCLECHEDKHSLSFYSSAHGALWDQVKSKEISEENGVSCSTCHMPRIEHPLEKNGVIYVEHNQNYNLRPNEKMIRSVCMNCHGLQFSLNALSDKKLIENNFNGMPGIHIESIEWAISREKRN